jgi:hypothetical protein
MDISLLGAQRCRGQHQAARNLRQASALAAPKYTNSADGFHAAKLITGKGVRRIYLNASDPFLSFLSSIPHGRAAVPTNPKFRNAGTHSAVQRTITHISNTSLGFAVPAICYPCDL